MNKKQIVNILIAIILFINGILGIKMSNTMIEQSAEIQQLKQNNAEQEVEKEYYIRKVRELEDRQ